MPSIPYSKSNSHSIVSWSFYNSNISTMPAISLPVCISQIIIFLFSQPNLQHQTESVFRNDLFLPNGRNFLKSYSYINNNCKIVSISDLWCIIFSQVTQLQYWPLTLSVLCLVIIFWVPKPNHEFWLFFHDIGMVVILVWVTALSVLFR